MSSLTIAEARAILRADEALGATFKDREESGNLLSLEEMNAWIALAESARKRVEEHDALKGGSS